MRRRLRFLAQERGTAALEFALIGLPFILLLFGLIEIGRGLLIRAAIDEAADRAQRVLMIDPATDAATIEALVRSAFSAGSPDGLGVSHMIETVGNLNYRRLTVAYQMELLMPAPLGMVLPIETTRRVVVAP